MELAFSGEQGDSRERIKREGERETTKTNTEMRAVGREGEHIKFGEDEEKRGRSLRRNEMGKL